MNPKNLNRISERAILALELLPLEEEGERCLAINSGFKVEKWEEIKGEIRRNWGRVKPGELERTHGDLSAIQRLIKTKYSPNQLDHLYSRLEQIMAEFRRELREEERMERVRRERAIWETRYWRF